MFMKAKKKRPSKHERLLKALLSQINIHEWKDGSLSTFAGNKHGLLFIKQSDAKQLIAIKEAMEKKARKV